MRVNKTARDQEPALQPGHLEDINRLSRTPLTEAEVYAFPSGCVTTRWTGTRSGFLPRPWSS